MPFQVKLHGLALALAKAREEKQAKLALAKENPNSEFQFTPVKKAKDRIIIVADNSLSMAGEKIKDSTEGMIEFLRNCTVNQTAVGVEYLDPVNPADVFLGKEATKYIPLTTNLPALSVDIRNTNIVSGTTPIFETLRGVLKTNYKHNITRVVLFSDGCPDNEYDKNKILSGYTENKIPIDTILITQNNCGFDTSEAEKLMKEIADRTGGLYLKFERGKVNFRTAFKYLAPKYRLALAASVEMQENLQAGKLT